MPSVSMIAGSLSISSNCKTVQFIAAVSAVAVAISVSVSLFVYTLPLSALVAIDAVLTAMADALAAIADVLVAMSPTTDAVSAVVMSDTSVSTPVYGGTLTRTESKSASVIPVRGDFLISLK